MKRNNYFLTFLLIFTLSYTRMLCQDGVKIGSQTWSSKNLDVSTFRNGDTIKEVKTEKEWKKATKEGTPAWCYYDNKAANGAKHGKLYNMAAVTDARGLAPAGWHIPSVDEWMALIDHLGGTKKAGDELKSSADWDGNNTSGFNAMPSGRRLSKGPNGFAGEYADQGSLTIYWTNTPASKKTGETFYIRSKSGKIYKMEAMDEAYLSVRCVKD